MLAFYERNVRTPEFIRHKWPSIFLGKPAVEINDAFVTGENRPPRVKFFISLAWIEFYISMRFVWEIRHNYLRQAMRLLSTSANSLCRRLAASMYICFLAA